MTALVASEDGRRVLRAEAMGAVPDAERVGQELAEELLEQGAASVVTLDPGRWAS
jgi:porphobilinogen deaminase